MVVDLKRLVGFGILLPVLCFAWFSDPCPAFGTDSDRALHPVVWTLLKNSSSTIAVPDGKGGTREIARSVILAGVCNQLAALSTQKALLSGQLSPGQEERAKDLLKVLKSLEENDVARAGLLPAGAQREFAGRQWINAGWWNSVVQYINQPQRQIQGPAAVAGVRGGRSVQFSREGSSTLQKYSENLSRVQSGLRTTPSEERGALYAKEGILYAKIARLVDPVKDSPGVPLSPSQIYKNESSAVVTVMGVNRQGVGELGAGSIITSGGDVITNAHVVIDHGNGRPFPHIFIYYKPATLSGDPRLDLRHRMTARIERYDSKLDLALLRPESPSGYGTILPVGNSGNLVPGTHVVAIGNPESGGLWSLTQGIISGRIADFEGVRGKNVFQTDAGMNRGNSGGPLIDRQGALVGINTAIARKSADGLAITNVNFSIQSDVVLRWIESSGGWPGGQPPPSPSIPAPGKSGDLSPFSSESPGVTSHPSSPPLDGLVTPARPFDREQVLEQEMGRMDRMGQEMGREAEKKLGKANQP